MTGNDIIDMAMAAFESNWKRKGFIEKIFTLQEQQYIQETAIKEEMIWKLWSMKESAYKIYNRQYGVRFFAPQHFSCTLMNVSEGTVDIKNDTYQTVTSVTENYIYSVACLTQWVKDEFLNCCFRLPQLDQSSQQQFINEKIINRYSLVTGKSKKCLSVKKDNNGIPNLFCRTTDTEIPLSITHHGNYAAFTIY